jgi:hypothetical protein
VSNSDDFEYIVGDETPPPSIYHGYPPIQIEAHPEPIEEWMPLPMVEKVAEGLQQTYREVTDALCRLATTQVSLMEDEKTLDYRRAVILRDNDSKTLGANAETREAAVLLMTQNEDKAVRLRKMALISLRAELEVAQQNARLQEKLLDCIAIAQADRAIESQER